MINGKPALARSARRLLVGLRKTTLGLGLCAWLAGTAAAQCAMCKEGLTSGQAASNTLARGMAYSIYFMLLAPLLVLALVVTMIVRGGRSVPGSPATGSPDDLAPRS